MATMITIFAVALFALAEVNSYPTSLPPTSLADLPIDCPFHREPVGLDHIGDTAYGTLTQTGNYEFSKIPGNLVESGQDYLGYASQAEQVFPDYQQGYQQPQSFAQEYPYPQQFPDYNQYQGEENYASILPYYGQQENYYQQPEDGFMSIQPYYGNQAQEQFDQYQNDESQDGFMSILPFDGQQYSEQNLQYGYDEQPEDDSYQNNEIVEEQYVNPEQENDFNHVVEVIDNCKSSLNAIYEAACEEITEAEETAAVRIEKARARVNSQSFEDFGLESYAAEQGFTRSMFSFFKPQNILSMPMKAVNTGMDAFVLSPLQAFSKTPAKKITEPVQVVQEKNTPVSETVQPEVKNMQNAKIEERQAAVNNAQCLRSVSKDVQRQFLQNNQEANQCINIAEARFHESVYSTRYNINENREIFENRSQHDGEIITMCANSQFEKCQEEEDLIQKTAEDFATAVNNQLTPMSDAEEILKLELTICETNAETRHEQLCDEASAAKADC